MLNGADHLTYLPTRAPAIVQGGIALDTDGVMTLIGIGKHLAHSVSNYGSSQPPLPPRIP